MPVRRLVKKPERPSPYTLPKPSNMTAVLSPHPQLPGWAGLNGRSPASGWQANLAQYQTSNTVPEYHVPIPAPTLMVQPPRSSAAPGHTNRSRRPSTSQGPPQPDGPWTADMDSTLLEAQARGLRWEQISQYYFPQKSANACRKRFGRAKEERRASDWDDRRMSRVMAAYNQAGMRERMWGPISRETGEKWQDVERWCFSQGLVKMTRPRVGHSRNRSHSSRLSLSQSIEDSRYHSSSNDEYDGGDEHAVGLGVSASLHAYHTGGVGPPAVSAGPTGDNMLHRSQYTYAT